MELKRVSDDCWECSDQRYMVYAERSPWLQEGVPDVPLFSIRVKKYGEMYYSPLRTEPSLSTALEYIKTDAAAPVFDESGMCRWCDMSRQDLATYPRWWFGCNLCETEVERTAAREGEL